MTRETDAAREAAWERFADASVEWADKDSFDGGWAACEERYRKELEDANLRASLGYEAGIEATEERYRTL